MSLQLGETFINYGGTYFKYYSFSKLFFQNNDLEFYIDQHIALFATGYAYYQSQWYLFSVGASSSFN